MNEVLPDAFGPDDLTRPCRARGRPTLDLTDPAFVADPYPRFAARARPRHPVALARAERDLAVVTHAAVSAVLRDRRLGRIWRDREPAATSSRSTSCTATR